jgi:amicyanin
VGPALAKPELNRKSRRAPWRVAALAAASTVTVAACGGASGASGAGSTPTVASPTSTISNAPAATAPGAPTSAPAPATTADIGIVDFKFTPAALTVKVGTTVLWTNKDTIAHTVNFTGGVNSSLLNQNDRFTHTFTAPGTYDYICSIHPFMHGSVTVTT